MHPLRTTALAGMAASLLASTGPALAALHQFQLTGHASSGVYLQASTGYSAVVALSDDATISGLLPALSVAVGDTLAASIVFDQALELPASAAAPQPYAAYFGFSLGSFEPQVPGGTTVFADVQTRFFDGVTEVFAGSPPDPRSGCGNLLCMGTVHVGATQALRFDRVQMTAQINRLAGLLALDQVSTVDSAGLFSAYVLTPVPEPATGALWLTGALAALVWRGRRVLTSRP